MVIWGLETEYGTITKVQTTVRKSLARHSTKQMDMPSAMTYFASLMQFPKDTDAGLILLAEGVCVCLFGTYNQGNISGSQAASSFELGFVGRRLE